MRLTLALMVLILPLLAMASCEQRPEPAMAVYPLCTVPTHQVLRSTGGDSLGVFTALAPCHARTVDRP